MTDNYALDSQEIMYTDGSRALRKCRREFVDLEIMRYGRMIEWNFTPGQVRTARAGIERMRELQRRFAIIDEEGK